MLSIRLKCVNFGPFAPRSSAQMEEAELCATCLTKAVRCAHSAGSASLYRLGFGWQLKKYEANARKVIPPGPCGTIVRALEKGVRRELFAASSFRRLSGHACAQRVVQFEVTDFTGVPSSGRFVWGLKKTLTATSTAAICNPIGGRRGGAHVRTTEMTPPGTSALRALGLNHTARTKNLVVARRPTEQMTAFTLFCFSSAMCL